MGIEDTNKGFELTPPIPEKNPREIFLATLKIKLSERVKLGEISEEDAKEIERILAWGTPEKLTVDPVKWAEECSKFKLNKNTK